MAHHEWRVPNSTRKIGRGSGADSASATIIAALRTLKSSDRTAGIKRVLKSAAETTWPTADVSRSAAFDPSASYERPKSSHYGEEDRTIQAFDLFTANESMLRHLHVASHGLASVRVLIELAVVDQYRAIDD